MCIRDRLMPNEREGDVGIGCELPSLTAFVVGEEDEFTIFHAFQQYGCLLYTSYGEFK